MQLIYHICTKSSWTDQQQESTYMHESIKAEGFIHASDGHQVEGVLGRYFAGADDLRVETLGIVAAILTTASFLPQAIKVIKTKETKDLSLSMYSMFFIGVVLWLTYGILIQNIPVIIANAVTFVLSGIILMMKIKYK